MSFQGREAVSIENDLLRVTVLREGGHVAEMFHKKQGISPLWIPPWHSDEPSKYNPATYPEYGLNSESKLLMGIMGHNLCLDIFGPPSTEEAAAGLTVHGESSVVRYEIQRNDAQMTLKSELPLAGLAFQRSLSLDGTTVKFSERVENLSATDRPIAWTQHVTIGPPFLANSTRFSVPAEKSRTFEDPSFDDGVLTPAADFSWPKAPLSNGGQINLQTFGDNTPAFSRYTAHLMKMQDEAGFAVFSPQHELTFGYRWKRKDFPWLGLWQENKKRSVAPWNNKGVTCGLEFGVSPFPETRRQMVSRASLFGTPVYRWLPAYGTAEVEYQAFVHAATDLAEDDWR